MARRTIDDIKIIFEENGCTLLETEYVNNKTKMKYVCSCGNNSKINLNNFNNGVRCYDCGNNKRIEKAKLSEEEIKVRVKNAGFEYLSHEKVKDHTFVEVKCLCGGISKTTLNNIEKTNGCMECRYQKENNPNWKGGVSSESNIIRTSNDYQTWRKIIFERDNYTCQCCKSIGGNLEAHHIENFSSNEDKRFGIDNGITMCEKCHSMKIKGSFHHVYGNRNNNRGQLEEYIMNYKEYQSKHLLINN